MADIQDKDPEKARKQIGKKGEKDSAKYIDIEPTLDEAKGVPAVFTFGRMNPIHTGHEKLVQKLMAVASAENGMPMLFLSHSQDGEKNPLPYNDKVKFAKKAFGNIVKMVPAKTIMQIMKGLNQRHKKVVLVVGSDRVKEFDTLLNKYNGKEYNFEDIKVVSAGGRDPDAEGVTGMSASKMREYASNRNISKFTKGLPKKLKDSAQDIMAAIRKGMNMSEEYNSENEDYLDDLESLDEALTRQQRRKAGQRMKRMRVKIKRGREKAARRRANIDTLKKRARKKARLMIKSRLAAGKRYADMEPAEKERIDKRLEKIPAQRLNNLAVKLLPSVKRAERDRLQARHNKEDLNVSAENFLAEYKTTSSKPQDPDVADRPGSQPKGYYKGVSKDKKDARAAHFERGAKMSDDNPAAYKPAPGDSDVKTKESKHTKKARAMGYTESNDWVCGKCFCEPCMCGTEDLNEMWGKYVTKRPHMLMDKNNKVKFDKRFKMYQRKSMEESLNMDMSEVEDLMESAEAYIKEDAAGKSLADKAKKSGMPKSILRQVYNRGVAAWRTGHRPGTTPEQWGHARVNSFITKSSGTWGKADKDLAAKVRKEEMNLDEAATPQMMKAAKAIEDYAKKNGGIDKADFMKAAKMLSSGKAGMNLVKFVDDLDTEPREWLITTMAKHLGKQTVEKMFKVKIREEVELDEVRRGASTLNRLRDIQKKSNDMAMSGNKNKPNKSKSNLDKNLKKLKNMRKADKSWGASDAFDWHEEATMSAVKRPVNVTGPDGKTRTVMKTTKPSQTDDHGHDKIKTNEDDASLAAHAEKEMRDREKRKEMEAIGKEVDEILDTPKAMKSYNDKNKASADRAANSAAAKILRGKDKDGKRADHSPELNTMRKRTAGARLSKNNAIRKTFKALRGESVIKEEGGAGEEGTDKLLKKFKKDTPGEK